MAALHAEAHAATMSQATLIDVGTARVAHTRTGSGPDLVFVHGWPLHGATFRAIVPVLAPRFTCHVLDLPGAGRSEWTAATEITLRGHAEAVLRAIEALHLDRVGFVAHDSGGGIARLAAAELGTRCFGLVLGNTEIPGYTPPALRAFATLVHAPGGKRVLPMIMRSRWLRRSRLGFGGCFHDRDLIDGEFGRLFVTSALASKRAIEGQLELLRQLDWDTVQQLATTHARITAPVRLIWGADDPWFPLARARRMLDQFGGGAELVEMANAKLFAHEERPDEWAGHALRFLVDAAARARVSPTLVPAAGL